MNTIDKFPVHPQQFYFSRTDWLTFLRETKVMLQDGTNPTEIDNIDMDDSATMLLAALSTMYATTCLSLRDGDGPELIDYVNKHISTAMLLDTCEVILFEIIPTDSGYQIELTYKSMNGRQESVPTMN